MVPVAILCGGKGTRIARGDRDTPKPLVDVGGHPILWHVMALYAAQGFREFVLLTGWQSERVEAAVRAFAEVRDGSWRAEFLRTGEETPTGGRVHAARERLGEGTFALTYADGVADIDLRAELEFHRAHGSAATIAVVQPRSPWGSAALASDGAITGFEEKPRLSDWINGGFMYCEPAVFDVIGADDVLEREPLERLAQRRELFGFRHDGFWDCMDTYKDALVLNELCAAGAPPWLPADRTGDRVADSAAGGTVEYAGDRAAEGAL
ncbi:MAG: NTP transferase domain-containing protein [Actinobacteria bacterium]|nr:NTP transferase domain-containing protein [Actinomycetota bacterium]